MNLRDDKRWKIQELDFSLPGPGEARGPVEEGAESSRTVNESESPANTRLAQPTRTAVYGPVRTVVWQGPAGDRRPYADRGGAEASV